MRLLVFPALIYATNVGIQFPKDSDFADMQPYLVFCNIYKGLLACLHYFWYSLLYKATVKALKGAENIDDQNDLSKMYKNKKE